MRSYSVANASLAIAAPAKWLDNLLSRYSVPGVDQGRQGVDRRISPDALERLRLVRTLNHDCGIPVSGALALVDRLMTSPTDRVNLGMGLELRLSRSILRQHLEHTVAEASTGWIAPRRGRPAGASENESAGEDRSPAL